MADNTTLPGTGDVIAADDVGGVKYQQVKLVDGTLDSSTPVGTTTNPLKVAGPDCVSLLSTTLTTTGVSSSIDTSGYGAVVCQISGVWQGNCTFEASNDNSVWDTIYVFSRDNLSLQDIITSGGLYTIRPSGRYLRINVANITGSLVVNALGRDAEGISASDLLSLAMDRQNNTPLQVQLNGMRTDVTGALIPSDGIIADYRALGATVPTGALYIIDTAGYNSIYISASVSMSLTVTGYAANSPSSSVANPHAADWVAVPGTYISNGSFVQAGLVNSATAGTPFNQNSGNVTHMWFPVTGRYFKLHVLSGGGPGVLITSLRNSQAPDQTTKNINISTVTASTGTTLTGIGSVPVSGQVKTAVLGARTDGTNYWPTLSSAGQLITKDYSFGETDWQFTGTLTTTTAQAMKAAGAAGVRNYVTAIQFHNTSATATTIIILDGATTLLTLQAPATMTMPVIVTFPTPLRGTAATAMNVNCGTTAANVLMNAQGYQSA